MLPGGNRPTQEFSEFCMRNLGLTHGQILWTAGRNYLMDDDIREELLFRLQREVCVDEWELIPYSVTEPFLRWANQIKAPFFGDDEQWVKTYSNKRILHQNAIPQPHNFFLPLLSEEIDGIRLPRNLFLIS